MNKLPQNWAVKCPEDYSTNEGWKKVIEYINKERSEALAGLLPGWYYGYFGNMYDWSSPAPSDTTILTIDQFLEMTSEVYIPEFGEMAEFSDDGERWFPRIFLSHIRCSIYPFIVVQRSFEENFNKGEKISHTLYKHCRPLTKISLSESDINEAREYLAKKKGCDVSLIKLKAE